MDAALRAPLLPIMRCRHILRGVLNVLNVDPDGNARTEKHAARHPSVTFAASPEHALGTLDNATSTAEPMEQHNRQAEVSRPPTGSPLFGGGILSCMSHISRLSSMAGSGALLSSVGVHDITDSGHPSVQAEGSVGLSKWIGDTMIPPQPGLRLQRRQADQYSRSHSCTHSKQLGNLAVGSMYAPANLLPVTCVHASRPMSHYSSCPFPAGLQLRSCQ